VSIGVIGCRRDIADKIIGRSITSSSSRKDRNFRIGVPASRSALEMCGTSAQGSPKAGAKRAQVKPRGAGLTLFLVPLSQPYPWAAAVLVYELHAGGF
jgi:hypothetical protein